MTLDEFLLAHDGLKDLSVLVGFIGAFTSAITTGIFVRSLF